MSYLVPLKPVQGASNHPRSMVVCKFVSGRLSNFYAAASKLAASALASGMSVIECYGK